MLQVQRAGVAAPQQGPHPGLQFGQIEGLGQVVVGALVQPAHAVGQGVERGEHQHRHLQLALTQPAQHLQAAQARQADVQDDQVVGLHHQRIVGLLSGVHRVHGIGRLHQRAAECVGQHLVVFDQEDAHG